jgi:hypothetical protein
MFKKSNRRAFANFLVNKRGVAIYNTPNTTLTVPSTNAIVVADGSIGFFDASGMGSKAINTSLNNTTTLAQSPEFFILQGNENSATPWVNNSTGPLWTRPYERSNTIEGQGIISVTKQSYAKPTHSTWVTGGPAGAIVAQPNKTYQLGVAFRGHQMEEYYSTEEALYVNASFTTPDYVTLATPRPLDHMIQNLLYTFNRNSSELTINAVNLRGNYPVIAFAVDTTGATGTLISSLTANTFLPVVNTPNGVKGIYLTSDMVDSLKASITASNANIPGASIITIDLATAGALAGGNANAFMTMALDNRPAYFDYGTKFKNQIIVGLTSGFDSSVVRNKEYSFAFEGQGTGVQLDRMYRNDHGQRKYDLINVEHPIVEFPSPIDKTDTYNMYVITHQASQSKSINQGFDFFHKEMILVPTLVKGVVDVAANPQVTALDSFLNTYLASANKSGVTVI